MLPQRICRAITHAGGRSARRLRLRPQIVSEKLCDDILQRLKPFLLRDRHIDILDLWPGCGLWSARVHDLVRPRRHVLVEPDLSLFGDSLKALARERPSWTIRSEDVYELSDWKSLFDQYLPEQEQEREQAHAHAVGGSSSSSSSSTVRNDLDNDTLLVLAAPPISWPKSSLYTPSQWMSWFLTWCVQRTGPHLYGAVRAISLVPTTTADSLVPRAVQGRGRLAMLAEALSRNTFLVAASPPSSDAVQTQETLLATQLAATVQQRCAERDVVIPAGREMPDARLAPDVSSLVRSSRLISHKKKNVPYAPRPWMAWHADVDAAVTRLMEAEASSKLSSHTATDGRAKGGRISRRSRSSSGGSGSGSGKKDSQDLQREQDVLVVSRLLTENSQEAQISETLQRFVKADQMGQRLAWAAATAPQHRDLAALKDLDRQAAALWQEYTDSLQANVPAKKRVRFAQVLDDRIAMLNSGSFDESVLLWGRRPFDPLCIQGGIQGGEQAGQTDQPGQTSQTEQTEPAEQTDQAEQTEHEIYPPQAPPVSMVYIEPNGASNPISQTLASEDSLTQDVLMARFKAVLSCATSPSQTVRQLCQVLFPDQPANEVVRSIPALSRFAVKRLKPGFERVFSRLVVSVEQASVGVQDASAAQDKTLLLPAPFSELLDYDLGEMRARAIPAPLFWELVLGHQRSPFRMDEQQLRRALGVTAFRPAAWAKAPKQPHFKW